MHAQTVMYSDVTIIAAVKLSTALDGIAGCNELVFSTFEQSLNAQRPK
jgi:hypothetical protein